MSAVADDPGNVIPVEYLYGIQAEGYDGNDNWTPARIVAFRITKKTPKRIYYVRRDDGLTTWIGYVNRQKFEADGEIYNHSAHWSFPEFHLYLNPPEIAQHAKPDLSSLKTAMAAAHPDRGGTDAEFIEARRRYEEAKGGGHV